MLDFLQAVHIDIIYKEHFNNGGVFKGKFEFEVILKTTVHTNTLRGDACNTVLVLTVNFTHSLNDPDQFSIVTWREFKF